MSTLGAWRGDFRRIWTGESVSRLGSEVTLLALPVLAVVELHATVFQLGLLAAARYLPYLLVALPAGLLVDRVRRRPLMIGADIGAALALGAVPILAILGRLSVSALLAIAFIIGLCQVLFELACQAYLPTLVPSEELALVNARLTASESIAEVGGPGLGGWLVQVATAPVAILADAISFLASGLALWRVRTPEPGTSAPPARSLGRDLFEGIRLTFTNGYLRAFAGEAASYNLCWQAVMTLIVVYAIRDLGLRPAELGLLLAIGSLGALLGALLARLLGRHLGVGPAMIIAAVLADLTPMALPLAPHTRVGVAIVALALFLRGVGVTSCNVHVVTVRQTETPNHLLGRAGAGYRFIVSGMLPLGSLAGGALAGVLGLRTALLVATSGLLTTWLWLYCSPVRHLRASTSDEEEPNDARRRPGLAERSSCAT